MSFQPTKDSSGKIIKKSLTQGASASVLNTGYSVSSSSSLFHSGMYAPTVSANGVDSTNIGYLDATEGSAQANKVLLTDTSNNISGINVVRCKSITTNGVLVDPNVSTENITPVNDYYGSLTPGTAQAGKALVLNSSKNYTGLKKITAGITSSEGIIYSAPLSPFRKFNAPVSLAGTEWYDCVYSADLSKFLCVGTNKIALSATGSTWEEKTVAVQFKRVVWAPHKGMFYAVAADGIHTSNDGRTWNNIFTATGLNSIAVGANVSIAVGTTTYYSGDYYNWYSLSSAVVEYKDIAFGSGKFVAVGTNSIASLSDDSTPILTIATSFPNGQWSSVAYGNGQFLAVSSQATLAGKFTTSVNSTSWSSLLTWVSLNEDITAGWRVRFMGGFFYCMPILGAGSECTVYYTKDGCEWNQFKHHLSNHLASMAWDSVNDRMLLLTLGTQMSGTPAQHMKLKECRVQYLEQGGSSMDQFAFIKHIPETNITLAGSSTLCYSLDGVEFKQCTVNSSAFTVKRSIYGVAYSPTLGIYVAASDYLSGTFTQFLKSTNGINWTECGTVTQTATEIIWSPLHSKFIGIYSNNLVHSSDAVTWQSITAVGARTLFAMESQGIGLIRNSGITKIEADMNLTTLTASGTNYNYISYINGTYYATYFGNMHSSPDAVNWSSFYTFTGSAVPILWHKALNAIVLMCTDNIVRVYRSGSWSTYTYTGAVTHSGAVSAGYSETEESIYCSFSSTTKSICKTVSTKSMICVSETKPKVYRALPVSTDFIANLDDAIYTSFFKNTLLGATSTGASAIERIFFSRSLGVMYGFKTSPSVSNYAIYSNNAFRTYSNLSTHQLQAINLNANCTLWLTTTTFSGNCDQTELNSTGGLVATVSSSFIPYASVTTYKLKKVKSFYYGINGNFISVYAYTQDVSGSNLSTSLSRVVLSCALNSLTYTDYVINEDMTELVTLTSGNQLLKYEITANASIPVVDITLPAGSYKQLEYFKEGNIYLLTSSTEVRWSSNCSTWNTIPVLSGLTYGRWSMNYIPELNMMTIVSTAMFAYTRNGTTWTKITTSQNKLWTSCDYNSYFANFLLHCSSDGTVLTCSPVMPTYHNVSAPASGYVKGKSFSIWSSGSNYIPDPAQGSHSFEVGRNNVMVTGSGRTITFNKYSDILTMSNNNINFLATDVGAVHLKMNNKPATLPLAAVNSLGSIWRQSIGPTNNALLVAVNGNAQANQVTCTSITVGNLPDSNIAGPVVLDSNKNAFMKSLQTTTALIGGTNVRWSKPAANNSKTLTIHDYMKLKTAKFTLGNQNNSTLGAAYSPELKTVVIWADANNTTGSEFFYVSRDKGANWTRVNAYGSSIYTSVSTVIRRIMWCAPAKAFIAAGNNTILYSRDGYAWYTVSVSIGNNPHLCYDSKMNRIIASGTSKLAWTTDILNLDSWTLATNATSIYTLEYLPFSDKYYYVNSSSASVLRYTTNIYATTITEVTLAAASASIYNLEVMGDYIYYCTGSAAYRKNDVAANLGTQLTAIAGNGTHKRMQYLPGLNAMILFNRVAISYSTDGLNWTQYSLSHDLTQDANASNEGDTNYAWFADDRIMVSMKNNGEVLESDLSNTSQVSAEYLSNLIENRTGRDPLMNYMYNDNNSMYMKHSSTNRNLYATAYGNGSFLTVGTDVNMTTSSLSATQTFTTHVGEWKDVIYDGTRFVKVGTDSVSYSSNLTDWTTSTVTGAWTKIVFFDGNYFIASSTTVQYSADLSAWTDKTPSSTAVNGLSVCNSMLFLLSTDKILYAANTSASWTTQPVPGTWYDIAYGKGLYVLAGDGWMARARSLNGFIKTMLPRTYNKVIYVRLYADFFLMSKTSFYDVGTFIMDGQNNSVIRTHDGYSFSNSLRVTQSSGVLNLSNLYYFEETDQFFLPLNNSPNKLYIVSSHTVARSDFTKITTPACFTANRVWANNYAIDIARGTDMTTQSPTYFNVWQDSAAKPSTSTWLTTSDERLKEDINPADLSICYNNVSSLPLKYYKWKDEYISEDKSADRHKLGWIAQDVEQYIPKAVSSIDMYGFQDCKTLDTDQIIANMYGAIQSLIKKIEEKEQAVAEANMD